MRNLILNHLKEEDTNMLNVEDSPIVIVGIGHSILHQNAQSNKLAFGPLQYLAISKGVYNTKLQCVTEFLYCDKLSSLIVKELKKKGIIGLRSNRYKGYDLNGGSQVEGAISPEIDVINGALGTYGSRIKAAINLHCNSTPEGTGCETLAPYTEPGKNLASCLEYNMHKATNLKVRARKYPTGENAKLGGMGYPRSTIVTNCLFELFFIDNNEDLMIGLKNMDKIAESIAQGFKDFIDQKFPPFDLAKAQAASRIQSVSLISPNKLSSRINDEQYKTIALRTQDKLTPIERQMGLGGDTHTYYLKNSIEIIGTAPPPYSPTITDPNGNVMSRPILREGGIVQNQKTYASFQNIDYTSDMPTGKKIIYSNTSYEIKSYEINLDASGHTRINTGGNMKITSGQQIDVVSAFNLNLTGPTVVNISGSDINLTGNTCVSGSMAINGGTLVNGSLYAGGGLNAPSFNGPSVTDSTNEHQLYGYLSESGLYMMLTGGTLMLKKAIMPGDTQIEIASGSIKVSEISGGSGQGTGGNALVTIPPHNHQFKRLNGILADSSAKIQALVAPQVNS